MVKANSLIYAIYVCLIVSILCSAMLTVAGLYDRLNTFYALEEDLYVENQSSVNYALGNSLNPDAPPPESAAGIESSFAIHKHGFIDVLLCVSHSQTDTVRSAMLTGTRNKETLALYVSDLSRRVTSSGRVTINGDIRLPLGKLWPGNIDNNPSAVKIEGSVKASGREMPVPTKRLKEIYGLLESSSQSSRGMILGSKSLRNSFFAPTSILHANKKSLENIELSGNILVVSTDSLLIRNTAILNDVVVFAQYIEVEQGFKGSAQLCARNGIFLREEVTLEYPSVLCVYDESEKEDNIQISQGCRVEGMIALGGKDFLSSEKGKIIMDAEAVLAGSVFCWGTFQAQGKILGSVYTNAFLYQRNAAEYKNYIADIKIDNKSKPAYFLDIPFDVSKKGTYGIIKKVF